MNRILIAAIMLGPLAAGCGANAAAGSAGSAKTAAATTVTVKGVLDLSGGGNLNGAGRPCTGSALSSGYADIGAGAQVVVSNASGKTVAFGVLRAGRSGAAMGLDCVFPFTVPGVPKGLGIYGVEVSHRGVLRYREAELAKPLTMTLGN